MKREEAEELLENFEHQITLDANGVLSDMGRQNLYCARQEIRAAWDAVHNVTPKEPTIPTEPGKYVMSVDVEVREGLCGLIMWVPGILCMVSVDYFRGATFRKV